VPPFFAIRRYNRSQKKKEKGILKLKSQTFLKRGKSQTLLAAIKGVMQDIWIRERQTRISSGMRRKFRTRKGIC
jgi:hypothetical protein